MTSQLSGFVRDDLYLQPTCIVEVEVQEKLFMQANMTVIKRKNDALTIGELAERTGLSVTAIRFYESKNLVSSNRSPGGQRRFPRSSLHRLSFVKISQNLGFSLRML